MSTWTKQKLGDFGKVITGKTPPTSRNEFYGGTFPFITPTDISDNSKFVHSPDRYLSDSGANYLKTAQLPKDTVCYTSIASIGKIAVTTETSFTNQQINSIIVNPSTHSFEFLFNLLKYKTPQIRMMAGGVASPIINKTTFEKIEVSVPDLPTQTRIASVLSTYDDLIENNEKRIKILEEMAERLYQQWFVKFKFPGHEKVKLIDSGTEYGKIPEGWMVKKLSEIASIVRGCSYSSEEIDDFSGDFYIVNLKSFNRGGGFRFDGAKYYSGKINDNQKINTGDIVVAVTDMTTDRAVIARPARVPEIDGKITFSADVVKINSDTLPSSFIYELLSTYKFTEKTKQMANGANVLHLKPSAILEFNALIPDDKILKQFDILCKTSSMETDKLLKANDNLSKTRDLLIPQLVTGRREVK